MMMGGLWRVAVVVAVMGHCHTHHTAVWLSAALKEEGALEGKGTVYDTSSWTHCVALGRLLRWPLLACYRTPHCALYTSSEARPAGPSKHGDLEYALCKVMESFTGCFKEDDTVAALGETRPNRRCGALKDVCEEGGFVFKAPVLKKTCESPFENRGPDVGCLYLIEEKKTWCEALAACFDAGGDMYSADTDQEFENLQRYLKATEYISDETWVGVELIGDQYRWIHSNNSVNPKHMKDASKIDTSNTRAWIKKGDWILEPKKASEDKPVLCRVWV